MNRVIVIAILLSVVNILSACSTDEPTEEEVSYVTNEGPYGGYSVQWYKVHWKAETKDQRMWCRQQGEAVQPVKSCIDSDIGWKQGWADPKTNPPRRWEDGPKLY